MPPAGGRHEDGPALPVHALRPHDVAVCVQLAPKERVHAGAAHHGQVQGHRVVPVRRLVGARADAVEERPERRREGPGLGRVLAREQDPAPVAHLPLLVHGGDVAHGVEHGLAGVQGGLEAARVHGPRPEVPQQRLVVDKVERAAAALGAAAGVAHALAPHDAGGALAHGRGVVTEVWQHKQVALGPFDSAGPRQGRPAAAHHVERLARCVLHARLQRLADPDLDEARQQVGRRGLVAQAQRLGEIKRNHLSLAALVEGRREHAHGHLGHRGVRVGRVLQHLAAPHPLAVPGGGPALLCLESDELGAR
mmetsp:Transcript_98902/g.308185  ORF Transcript_98902/g.308185 Transcript_98902/m.308185 type:complete len:308 (-) Transcript_98902:156-1079(-)